MKDRLCPLDGAHTGSKLRSQIRVGLVYDEQRGLRFRPDRGTRYEGKRENATGVRGTRRGAGNATGERDTWAVTGMV